ncbi:MAG: isochorismatase family protein [Rhodopila sp.]
MPLIDRRDAVLLLIDFQSRLMPAIDDGAAVIANAQRLIQAARKFAVPFFFVHGGKCRRAWRYISGTGTGRIVCRTQDDIRRLPLTGFPETIAARS